MARMKIKNKFDAEFHCTSFLMTDVGTYEHFKTLIERLHKLNEIPFGLSYISKGSYTKGHLLLIDNDDNLRRAVLTAKPLLRIITQRKGKIRINTI